MVVKYFYDLMSQPSRALYIFLKLTKIPFEPCPVALRKGEHFTEEFKRDLSRFQKVPFIHDNNLKLAESVAIFRYLTREYPVEDHWYPKDSKQQAKVDEYLEWQHLNVRFFCASYFQIKWLQPILTGKPANPQTVERHENNMVNSLDQLEELFLSDGPFINGFQKITIADVLAACEVEQTRMTGFEPTEGRPMLQAWLDRVKNECNPYYEEAHQVVRNNTEKTKKGLPGKL